MISDPPSDPTQLGSPSPPTPSHSPSFLLPPVSLRPRLCLLCLAFSDPPHFLLPSPGKPNSTHKPQFTCIFLERLSQHPAPISGLDRVPLLFTSKHVYMSFAALSRLPLLPFVHLVLTANLMRADHDCCVWCFLQSQLRDKTEEQMPRQAGTCYPSSLHLAGLPVLRRLGAKNYTSQTSSPAAIWI